MIMTDDEITNSYRLSKRPKQQIVILAELNGCSVSKIENILFGNTEFKPKLTRRTGMTYHRWTDDEIIKMGYLRNDGMSISELAVKFGVPYSSMRNALRFHYKKKNEPSTH